MPRARIEIYHQSRRTAVGNGYVTPREREVIQLYADGETPKSIGPLIGIDHRTVAGHMRRAKDRIEAKTYWHLVAMFVEATISERGRSSNREPFTDLRPELPRRAL